MAGSHPMFSYGSDIVPSVRCPVAISGVFIVLGGGAGCFFCLMKNVICVRSVIIGFTLITKMTMSK